MASIARIAPLLVLLLAQGCATPPRSLYADLGGRDGVDAIALELLSRTSDDSRIAHHFRNANIVRLHEKLVELICVEAGGPCVYSGASMAEAHAGRGLTEADFNALVENLIDAMESLDVPRRAQFRLLERLAAMHGEVLAPPRPRQARDDAASPPQDPTAAHRSGR
ncbi:group I truncated hemoglobin [Chiayiivirga flava]|uniref:Hemoglobin n=1 Tax=Chiayiivirga flava TaxID=659595 RepID=A0A7W8D2F3_9GAMM|nr:group 1 truncated hemoglobin [Chiayiivirga flava]MBB5206740.1 hemoglobin [Chiayiivirga flava]